MWEKKAKKPRVRDYGWEKKASGFAVQHKRLHTGLRRDGFETERSHLGSPAVIVGVDNFDDDKARNKSVDRIN